MIDTQIFRTNTSDITSRTRSDNRTAPVCASVPSGTSADSISMGFCFILDRYPFHGPRQWSSSARGFSATLYIGPALPPIPRGIH